MPLLTSLLSPAIVGTLDRVIHDMNEAEKNTKVANETTVRAAERMGNAKAMEKISDEKFESSKNRIINRKKAVINSAFPKFMTVYNKIIKIEFNRCTEGIKEIFQPCRLKEFETYVGEYLTFNMPELSDKQLVSGFAVDCTKAYFRSFITAENPLISGITASIVKDSELQKTVAYAQKKQARLYEEAVDAKMEAVEYICFYMDKTSDIIAKFNGFFLKSIDVTEKLIEKNGYAGENYSDEEYKKIGVCMNLAAALKDIVDAPILDNDNEVTQVAKNLIETSEQCINVFTEIL